MKFIPVVSAYLSCENHSRTSRLNRFEVNLGYDAAGRLSSLHIVDRYITSQTMKSISVVVVALLALVSLFALFEELDERSATYGLHEAFLYILKTSPRRLDEILVYGVFLGALIALGRLAETHELTVLRVSGMSPLRLLLALVPSIVIWLLISFFVGEWLAPVSERSANVDKLKAMYGAEGLTHSGGLWVRTGNLYMQVNAIDEVGDIHGVVQYFRGEGQQLQSIVVAEIGRFDGVAEHWRLINGSETRFAQEGATTRSFRVRAWQSDVTPEVLASQAFLEPNKMSILSLHRQVAFGLSQHLGTSQYQLAFWSRVLKPVTYFGLAFFALSVVLGPLREVGVGLRLTFGIFAGLGFKYLQDLFAPFAIVFDIPALIAITLPIALYWAVACYLAYKKA